MQNGQLAASQPSTSHEPPSAGENEGHQQQENQDCNINGWQRLRQPHIWWLLPFAFLYSLSFGGLIVPKINLTMSLVCRDYFARKSQDPNFTYTPVIFDENDSHCRLPEIQSLLAKFQLYMNLVTGIISALASPHLGQLSDRHGRTTIIALCTMGTVLNEAITTIVASWPEMMSINTLLIGAFMEGLGGSFTTAQALICLYASDCTLPNQRSVAFSMLHGALFLGIAIGPTTAAYLINKAGHSLFIFYIGLTLPILYCITVFLVVPESLPKKQQLEARQRGAKEAKPTNTRWYLLKNFNPLNFFTPLKILLPAVGKPSVLFPNRRGASRALRRNIILIAMMDIIIFGTAMGTVQVIIIYVEYLFDWGNVETSLFVSIINVVSVVNLFVVLPLVARFFRTPSGRGASFHGSDSLDIALIRFSIASGFLGFIGYALSRRPSTIIISGAIASLSTMGPPTLQSSMTKHIPLGKVGQVLGATGLLHSLARVVAPSIFNLIYTWTVAAYPQILFILVATIFSVMFFLSFFIRPHVTIANESVSDATLDAARDRMNENDPLLIQ